MARDDDRYIPGRNEPIPSAERDQGSVASLADQEFEIDDIDSEEQPQFLRAQRRIPVRKGPVTKKTANRLRIVVIIATVFGVVAGISVGLYGYATRSWRFRFA
jgi:hypothetical protein